MANNSLGKRPCSICRKWFKPDVRQKGRQKTCGNPDCMKEQHRRQCEKWNKKNREYSKNNYLGKKIEIAENKKVEPSKIDNPSQKQLFPNCGSDKIMKSGWNALGTQRTPQLKNRLANIGLQAIFFKKGNFI